MQVIGTTLVILGAVYVLVLPGLAISFAFFKRGSIDIIERIALSFALSIAVVPLVVFYLNLAGVRISRTSVLIEVAVITAVALAIGWRRNSFTNSGTLDTPLPVPIVEKPAKKPKRPNVRL